MCEALENRVLLSNPIVLDPLPRDQRDNYIAPTASSAVLAAPPEHFEYEFTEPRLVYRFDQPVSGLGDGVSNQNHVLTSLYQVVQVENPAYPLDDVPLTVWAGPFGTERHTVLLDSADGVNWTGSNGDVTATLIPQEYLIWQNRLTVTTPTGSVTWRMSWNGYNGAGYISPDAGSVSGDGADYYIESFGTPRFSNSHVGGNVVEGLPTPTTSDNLTFIIPTALPNGYYDAVLSSLGITNIAGEHLDGVDGFFDGDGDALDDPGDYIYSFFVLAGDANHDRVINITDFGVIDANVGQSGSVFGFFNGDFNYDGKINIEDYGIIDSNYATRLPAPLTGANQLSASAAYEVPGITNSIRLQWTAPEGATDIDSWGLWRSIDGGVTFTLLTDDIPGTARSWDDIGDGQGLPEGSKFTYRLRAFSDELGYSETTNKAWSVTNLPGPLTATITDVTTTSMTLNWADNATNETGYQIWQAGVLVDTVPANSTSYTIRDLTPNTAYNFAVNAYTNATGSLPAGAQATTLDGPVEPANLVATPLSDGHRVQLSWGNVENEAGFLIERSTEGGEWQAITTLAPDVTTYLDEGLNSLSIYEYRVTSLGENTSALGSEAFAYGTTSTRENNSPPSEEAFTLTDHGNGVVYSGPPSDDTEDYTFDDVTAQWSGPWNRTDGPVLNEAITLTLDNLPDHYGLEVHFFGSAINAGHTLTDSDTLTLSGLGDGSEYVMDHQDLFLWDLHVTADHSGDSVTLTVEGSDFESGQVWWGQGYAEDSWGMEGVEVKLLRYRVGLSANTLTINNDNEEPVPVTVTKADGTPAAGVELSAEREDGVELTDSTNTNSEGVALVSLKGVKLGIATLVLQAAGGARAAARPIVGPYTVSLTPNGPSPIGPGQSATWNVRIKDAKGVTVPNTVGPSPKETLNAGGSDASVTWTWSKDANGLDWILTATCNDVGTAGNSVTVDVWYPPNPVNAVTLAMPVKANVGIAALTITVTPAGPPPFDMVVGQVQNFVVKVWAGAPGPGTPGAAGVKVSTSIGYSLSSRYIAVLQPKNGVTDAGGELMCFGTLTSEMPPEAPPHTIPPTPYVATFWIGNGRSPGSKTTATGNLTWGY